MSTAYLWLGPPCTVGDYYTCSFPPHLPFHLKLWGPIEAGTTGSGAAHTTRPKGAAGAMGTGTAGSLCAASFLEYRCKQWVLQGLFFRLKIYICQNEMDRYLEQSLMSSESQRLGQ